MPLSRLAYSLIAANSCQTMFFGGQGCVGGRSIVDVGAGVCNVAGGRSWMTGPHRESSLSSIMFSSDNKCGAAISTALLASEDCQRNANGAVSYTVRCGPPCISHASV